MGIIYKITCNETGECYIGSTKRTMKQRMKDHRKDHSCSSRKIMDRGNYKYDIIEEVDIDILREREQYYIETTDCINVLNAVYTDENKKISQKNRTETYWEKRGGKNEYFKNDMAKRRQIKVVCECGTLISITEKNRHIKSKKHHKLLSVKDLGIEH